MSCGFSVIQVTTSYLSREIVISILSGFLGEKVFVTKVVFPESFGPKITALTKIYYFSGAY